ncbi:putative Ubiquitin carboxyl-terminal hydrolase family protein [Hibiscus syriacus]|uniref:Ubiquitin carboxyl-terminal hydrolase family protein n=1 Tax=Hibiscus syriacus TaxID=106335 RepID=A0A6A3AGY5_HIBSY|nr:probable BOI-related E3 ubiquitin-protein ligase 3 [Hibiscus syriacus]XP_039001460.1 probable BOI-related E3 ubiquitin-protein ligase 3 [Hibiscus syriacus]KAE8703376.1 putative Ubiquitin carboxyl-terminal hydrolase family protein [Hibiscus syriacus]
MAVEARHLTLLPPQFLGNREMMNPIEANGNLYPAEMGYGFPTAAEGLIPLYNSLLNDQKAAAAAVAAMKSESSLTYNNVLPLPRKRSRDSITPILSFPSLAQQQPHGNNNNKACSPFSFLGHDILLHMEQQQLDIDHLIFQHMEKMRVEIEEKRNRQARKIMEAMEGGVMKKLRAKEEEIEKIGKLNWALEERVKSLCIENQIWRDLAQTNEATANALRTNLEQVVAAAQLKDELTRGVAEAAAVEAAGDEVDDAQSCCGSSWEGEKQRTLAAIAEEGSIGSGGAGQFCRNCGKGESCVLLLPCRHLCLCAICGSTVHICPVCKSTKNASVHVNMS